jgi:hypothetical protein
MTAPIPSTRTPQPCALDPADKQPHSQPSAERPPPVEDPDHVGASGSDGSGGEEEEGAPEQQGPHADRPLPTKK